jgi:hypothetical protein
VRVVVAALAVLLLGGGVARAATPLARADPEGASVALAGDTALFARSERDGVRVFAGAADGSTRPAMVLRVPGADEAELSASPQRAAVVAIARTPQAFTGPPAGPWAALSAGDGLIPLQAKVDGDRVFVWGSDAAAERFGYSVSEGGAPPRPLALTAPIEDFAGTLAAYVDPADTRRLVVLDWTTGATRSVRLPRDIEGADLGPDGAAAVQGGGAVYAVSPAGAVTPVARAGLDPVLAGDGIVYAGGGRLRLWRPGAPARPIGVPSADIRVFTADARRVLWVANGCVLSAELTASPAQAPGPGPCVRTEVAVVQRHAALRGRAVPVTLRCVAAPRACRGHVRLRLRRPARGTSGTLRFAIPAGRRRTLALPLRRTAVVRGRRLELEVDVTTVDPGGRRNSSYGFSQAAVR